MRSTAVLAGILSAALLVAPAFAPTAAACEADAAKNVPCGYIYPLILIDLGDGVEPPIDLAQDEPLVLESTLTFKFDAVNEGFTLNKPDEPIVVTFEYPRKPDWVDLKVEPSEVEIPINPIYLQMDTSDPSNVQGDYVYTTDVTITADVTDQPVLEDGFDYAKLLVFAKSTESGLYKSGYGIKEIRVTPEGAVHASDVQGNEDVFEAKPLAPFTLQEQTRPLAGDLEVTLTPPGEVHPWKIGHWAARVNQPAIVHVSVTDESGDLVYATGPRRASGDAVPFNLTVPGPGAFTVGVHALPVETGAFLPATASFNFTAPPVDAEGVQYPTQYEAAYTEHVTEVQGNAQDPGFQYEKRIPVRVLDGATGAKLTIGLDTTGLPENAGTGAANLQMSFLDASGAVVLQRGVDPANPTKTAYQGALPGAGWYTVLVQGTGVPAGTAYGVDVTIKYDEAQEVRTQVDGVPDVRNVARAGTYNVTLDVTDAVDPWTALDLTPTLEDGDAPAPETRHAVTVVDAEGRLVYASGLRDTAVPFTPSEPGRYVAHVYLEPKWVGHSADPDRGASFQPLTLAFPLSVGNTAQTTYTPPPQFTFTDEAAVPAGTDARPVLVVPVTVLEGAGAFSATANLASSVGGSVDLVLLDAAGEEVARGAGTLEASDLAPGLHRLVVEAASPVATTVALEGSLDLGDAGSVLNPLAQKPAGAPAGEPGLQIPLAWATTAISLALAAGVLVVMRRP